MKTKILLAILVMMTFLSCKEEIIINNNEFTISSESPFFANDAISFTGDASQAEILITCHENALAWGIKCSLDDQWCRFEKDGKTLIVSAVANKTQLIRESSVTIVIGENEKVISVRQDYKRELTLPEAQITIGASVGTNNVPLKTNIENSLLNITSDSDWIKNLKAKDNILSFDVTKNVSVDNARTGTITIAYEDLKTTLTVIQNALSGYPYKIPIDNIDLDAYPVYEIWDRVHSVKIGEICKEFLYKLGTVKERLIVAYPYVSGKMNYTDGFVVSNSGSVSWDETSISSYIPGETTLLPDTLYISIGSTKISATPFVLEDDEKSILVITECVPMKVVDTRSGAANSVGDTEESFTYTVQKIGLQYWMRENLKTTRFRDGSNIPTGISNTNWGLMCKGALLPACKINFSSSDTYLDANDPAAATLRNEYGVNYDWAAIINDTLNVSSTSALEIKVEDKISAAGWSIPTREELQALYTYINQESLPAADFLPMLMESGTADFQNISGFSGKGGRWGSAKGGYNSGIYYSSLDYTYTPLTSDINTSGHLQRVASMRLDKTQTITSVNMGCSVYLRCIKK